MEDGWNIFFIYDSVYGGGDYNMPIKGLENNINLRDQAIEKMKKYLEKNPNGPEICQELGTLPAFKVQSPTYDVK